MRRLRAASGEHLFKAVRVRIFFPGNGRSAVQFHRAPAGRGLTDKAIEDILAAIATRIEQTWPGEEYALVELGSASFNFVWRKHKLAGDDDMDSVSSSTHSDSRSMGLGQEPGDSDVGRVTVPGPQAAAAALAHQ